MTIHGICLVKNEADVLAHSIAMARTWCDCIYIYDNGSVDGTWEIAQSLADDRVTPWRSEAKPFRDGLRSEVFNEFRHGARPGDWWCRLDADEFYVVDPAVFLARVPRTVHTVWGLPIEYHLTSEDLVTIDFSQPAETLLPEIRHYHAKNSEPRFFRYRNRLKWDVEQSWPRHMGPVYGRRIPYRHYKYRSPQQIQRRLETRRQATATGYLHFGHAADESWESKIVDSAGLHRDDGSDTFVIDTKSLPRHRSIGQELIKRILHGLGVWP